MYSLSSEESESLDDESDVSCFLCFRIIFFLSLLFLIDLLELLSFNKLDVFYDESDDYGSGSGSPGTCDFPFCFGKSVGSVGKSVGCVCGVEFIQLVTLLCWLCLYQEKLIPKVFNS